MPSYTVHFVTDATVSIQVRTADSYGQAIDIAGGYLPGPICFQCAGWHRAWTREEGRYVLASVTDDATGETVWTARVEK